LNDLARPLTSLRDAARMLLAVLVCRQARRSSSRVGVVLVYHRIGGRAGGDESREILAAVPGAVFDRQLRHLRRHYRVVSAAELLEAVRRRRRGERFPVAITFDDDLASHVRDALPALRRAGLSATFFLTGASLDGPHSFWWEDLQRAIDDELMAPAGLPHVDVGAALARSPRAILDLAGAIVRLPPQQRDEVAGALREAVGPPSADNGLRSHDVRALSDAGCMVGFHTLRHDALPGLSDSELEQALRDGREALAAAAAAPVDLLAYPHGKADARVAEAARAAGFAFGFTTARGAVTADTDPLRIPRTVADLSAGALALRLARLFRAAAG
jgi:peptidoglycan/xylan/chitin deacetylase (PgdA/CDA1 family)